LSIALTPQQVRRRQYYQKNKEREILANAKWTLANSDKMRIWKAEYRERNREQRRILGREYARRKRREDPEYNRQMYQKHKDKIKVTAQLRMWRTKRETVDAYGGKCMCCGEKALEFLSIDHIYNDGKQHRASLNGLVGSGFYRHLKKNGFPDKDRLQVLCYNCNGAKAYYGRCPHQAAGAPL
jgi:hypothetical protein